MSTTYLKSTTAPMYLDAERQTDPIELLWGDRIELQDEDEGLHVRRVRARGKDGYLGSEHLGGKPLLEFYFIDVGQGDGVLVRTPDGRHLMIDGGYKRASQPTGKNAADFVDWKFARDYGLDAIALDAMIVTHNDADHYGGLADLLDVSALGELDAQKVSVDAFYHAGVAWWDDGPGGERWLGERSPDGYLTRLMGDRDAVLAALHPGSAQPLQGEWKDLMTKVAETRTRSHEPTPVTRLSHLSGFLPGFTPDDGAVAVTVLGPVEYEVDGKPALRRFGGESQNTNGNSLLLRFDYGQVRVLLTGDLNAKSQRGLLDAYAGREGEFACDVAKACHHGSDDVSLTFLEAMQPAVTVISSGDTEAHDHPKPSVVAASALTGFRQVKDDKLVTPLIYSTELSRSLNLGKVSEVRWRDGDGQDQVLHKDDLDGVCVKTRVTKAGDLKPKTVTRSLDRTHIVADLVYGLVNVRTDGERIVCATLNEKRNVWQTKELAGRFG